MMKENETQVSEQSDGHLNYDTYIDERKNLISAENEVATRFDKSILTLSGGALLLSMTFLKEISSNPKGSGLLFVSWVLLAGAICFMLFSMLTSQSAMRKQREILGSSLSKNSKKLPTNWCSIITHWLNVLSITAFVVALVFMTFFIFSNMKGV